MVRVARQSGASAKFAGSGGAIVGTYEDDEQLRRLRADLAAIGTTVILPTVATGDGETADVGNEGPWRNS